MSKIRRAYQLHAGDTFSYGGEEYVAVGEPHGEFSTTILATRGGMTSDIYIPDHHVVEVLDEREEGDAD